MYTQCSVTPPQPVSMSPTMEFNITSGRANEWTIKFDRPVLMIITLVADIYSVHMVIS